MQIAAQKVVSISYTLKDDAGETIDSSVGGEPLVYIQGVGNLVPGLEKALEGKGVGDHVSVVVTPEEGYGVRDDSLIRKLPLRKLPAKVQPGSRVRAQTEAGPVIVTVTAVQGDYATVDPNHPLASKTLHFDVDVVAIRDATQEELEHGHAHGPEGHHH